MNRKDAEAQRKNERIYRFARPVLNMFSREFEFTCDLPPEEVIEQLAENLKPKNPFFYKARKKSPALEVTPIGEGEYTFRFHAVPYSNILWYFEGRIISVGEIGSQVMVRARINAFDLLVTVYIAFWAMIVPIFSLFLLGWVVVRILAFHKSEAFLHGLFDCVVPSVDQTTLQ